MCTAPTHALCPRHTHRFADELIFDFYRTELVPWLKARGAHLVLIGDNIYLPREPTGCVPPETALCEYSGSDLSTPGFGLFVTTPPTPGSPHSYMAALRAFEAEDPTTVHVFDQYDLWLDRDGKGSHLIPGTLTNGYLDQNHLAPDGALYLAPYLCHAFEEWGFFDD